MTRITLSSMSSSFFILLIITFPFFMQPFPVTADLKMRKLGAKVKAPPAPSHANAFKPPYQTPNSPPSPPPPI